MSVPGTGRRLLVLTFQPAWGSFFTPNKNRKVEEKRVIESTAKVEEKEEEEEEEEEGLFKADRRRRRRRSRRVVYRQGMNNCRSVGTTRCRVVLALRGGGFAGLQ